VGQERGRGRGGRATQPAGEDGEGRPPPQAAPLGCPAGLRLALLLYLAMEGVREARQQDSCPTWTVSSTPAVRLSDMRR
jgi:hypothetical protein